jgi:ABC-type Fe3+/spermidine/putrescine transport system ATPase subunit
VAQNSDDIVIRVRGLVTRFNPQTVHDGLDLDVRRGEVLGVVGGSGSGKSVLLRTIVGLNHPAEGSIEVLGQNTKGLSDADWRKLESRWGVLFQSGALFSSLTLADNVIVPLKERVAGRLIPSRRVLVLSDDGIIRVDSLPPNIRSFISEKKIPRPTLTEEGIDLNRAVEEFEYRLIDEALRRTKGNKQAAARLLGLKRTTLVAKLRRKTGGGGEAEGYLI